MLAAEKNAYIAPSDSDVESLPPTAIAGAEVGNGPVGMHCHCRLAHNANSTTIAESLASSRLAAICYCYCRASQKGRLGPTNPSAIAGECPNFGDGMSLGHADAIYITTNFSFCLHFLIREKQHLPCMRACTCGHAVAVISYIAHGRWRAHSLYTVLHYV